MTLSVKHNFVSAIADAGNPAIVQPSNWNDSHAMTQATATMLGNVSGSTGPTTELTPTQVRTLISAREALTASRTYYVGFNMGAATVSIASPGVVTQTGHSLVADSRVSFSILPNTKAATVSVATPAVVTMANTFVAGQPIVFASTGRLPKGLVAGTTYFVIATGLSGSSFQVSATVGGAAINTSNPTFTVTIASPAVVTETAHGRSTGDAIQLATTGALPTGLAVATPYFVNVIDANTYNLRLTPEGANINTTGTQSGTHTIVQFGSHFLSETGVLPTGITAGQDYFVLASGLTANTFQFATTSGGTAINTSGSTSGTIVLKTGSDSNAGLLQTATGAFLTPQKAIDTIASLDLSIYNATAQLAYGTYLGGANVAAAWVGAGGVTLLGDTTFPGNIVINPTGTNAVAVRSGGVLTVSGFETRGNVGLGAYDGGTITVSTGMRFGPSAAYQIYASRGSITVAAGYTISGGALSHISIDRGGVILATSLTINIFNVPSFSAFAGVGSSGSNLIYFLNTFNGFATGSRYSVTNGAFASVNGAGITYLPGSSAGSGTNFGVAPYGLYS